MSYFEDNSLKNIFLATSGDDGKTWASASVVTTLPMTTEPDGTGGFVNHGYFAVPYQYGMPVVRTPDQLTIVGVEHTNIISPPAYDPAHTETFWQGKPDSGARAGLVVMNYQAVGVAEPDQGSVIFKRTKPNLI